MVCLIEIFQRMLDENTRVWWKCLQSCQFKIHKNLDLTYKARCIVRYESVMYSPRKQNTAAAPNCPKILAALPSIVLYVPIRTTGVQTVWTIEMLHDYYTWPHVITPFSAHYCCQRISNTKGQYSGIQADLWCYIKNYIHWIPVDT